MGTNAFAVGLGLLVFLIMEAYVWYREGWDPVKQRFRGSAGFGLLVTVIVWLGLFGFCIMKVVYDNHQSLVNANIHKLKIIEEKDKTIATQKDTIQTLEAKVNVQPKVIYRDKQTSIATDTSRHLTRVQIARLKRMFSELPTSGPGIVVKTIANNQEAEQYATEINDALNSGRSTQAPVQRGLVWAKIPEGVLICTYSDTDPQINVVAERIVREMIALGIAVILNPNPSFPKNTVTILVGAKAIE